MENIESEELDRAIEAGQLELIPIRTHTEEDTRGAGDRGSVKKDYTPRRSRLFGEDPPLFVVDGLSKDAFFRTNFASIQQVIAAVNDRFELNDGLELSAVEVLAVTNAEMGMKGSVVDPKHDHKAGEYGLLPLSSIHKYVTGKDAPDPHGLYEPGINFEEFLMYLGGLKEFKPYKPIYSYPGLPGNNRRQAHTAAAVVHGYFYSPNYRPKESKPPNGNILAVIASDRDLGGYMKNTSFKAAWAVESRMKNLEAGMDLAEQLTNPVQDLSVAPEPVAETEERIFLKKEVPDSNVATLSTAEAINELMTEVRQRGRIRMDFHEFTRKYVEGEIPDEELKKYFEVLPADEDSLEPRLKINEELVEPPEHQRGLGLDFINGLANRRRRKQYRNRLYENPDSIRVLAEGDSWFQYPVLLRDVIDHLMDDPRLAVRCYSAAGDVLSRMLEAPEFLDGLEREQPAWFMISGGGNDLVDLGLQNLLHSYNPAKPPREYFKEEYYEFLEGTRFYYDEVVRLVIEESDAVKVVFHGYDYPVPNDGKWLGMPMNSIGITNKDLQYQIMRVVVDDINSLLSEVAAEANSERVTWLDLRNTVPSHGWHDEFHPNDHYYGRVAEKFRALFI